MVGIERVKMASKWGRCLKRFYNAISWYEDQYNPCADCVWGGKSGRNVCIMPRCGKSENR